MRSRPLLAAGTATAVLALASSAQGSALAAVDGPTAGTPASPLDATYDARATTLVRPSAAVRDAVAALVAEAGAGTRVTWDDRFGTPRSVHKVGGYLTGPQAGPPASVARSWLDAHRAAFGLTAADVAALAVRRDHALPGTGTHVVTFTQVVDGAEAAHGGRLTVAVAGDGRILSYAGNPRPSAGLAAPFSLSAADALARAAGTLAPGVAFTPSASGSWAGWTTFDKGPFAASSYVRKAAFPTADGMRPAWRVLFVKALDEGWDVIVDAATGAVLYRTSVVAHEGEGTVYENFPGAPRGGTPVVKSFGPTAESPGGYVDPTGLAGVDGPTTFGNNADTYANYSNFLVPADQGPRPVSPTSQFNYVYAQNWQRTQGATVPPSYALDLSPAATNLFWQHNRIHDEYYALGFTETAGNFQAGNNGKGGADGDPILGLVHAGAASGGAPTYTGRDNAYMLTLDDGIPPWSGMFLWEPIEDAFEGPYSDGNFDASVVQHEYTHGLSNRYVAGGSALGSQQAGSMGEGWSDWYALNHLYSAGLQSKAVVGEYVTGNPTRGIRNWDYDQNPTTFGDIGYDLTGPEVHADGEIWTATLWDLRKALVARYGAAAGAERAARIVTDAMPLTAPDPSFLDARDGILLADTDRYHGADVDTIWSVFAKRGAGASATSKGGDDTDPQPAFDHAAPSRNGRLVGKVVNASTGQPVAGARVIVGRFEARVSPLRRTSSTGGFSAAMVAGTYPVTIQAPGFGAQTFDGVTVTAGGVKALTFSVAPNLASKANGATVVTASSEDAANPARNLIDDTEASVWGTAAGGTPYNAGPDRYVTVKLAKPATVSALQVSAFKNTGSSRFAAVRDFTVQVSTDGVLWTTVKTGRFGYQTPRPVAPDLHYQRLTLATPARAAYVRFFADSVQGDTTRYAQAAEVQVFGAAGAVSPLPVTTVPPVTDKGVIAVGNPASGDLTGLQPVLGVTGTSFQQACGTMPPATQGADGWVSKLPAAFGDGTHSVTVAPDDPAAPAVDLDLYFLDANCELVGSQATAAAGESAALPGGTAYVLTQLYTGAQVAFTVTAT